MNYNFLGILLSIFLLSSCSLFDGDKQPSHSAFESVKHYEPLDNLNIYEYRLKKNNMQVFLIPKKGSSQVAYTTAYKVGSRDEEKGKTGLAHLFEHMMFRGTEKFKDSNILFTEWAGTRNATTSFDQTFYYEVAPHHYLDQMAEFEADRMRHLKIDAKMYETEKGAVVSERKMRTVDSVMGKLWWELYQLAYDKHSYKVTPIGFQKDLDRSTLEDALKFYRSFYAPNNAVVGVSGDFEVSDALSIIDKYYGNFESEEVKPSIPTAEPIRSELRRKVMSVENAKTVYIADARLGTTYEDMKKGSKPVIDYVLCQLLADSKTGYLPSQLVEKAIASSVGQSCGPGIDPDLAVLLIVGSPGVAAPDLEKKYDLALKGFESWVTQEKIDRVKKLFAYEEWSYLRTPLNIAQDIVKPAGFANIPMYWFDFVKKSETVTKAQVLNRFKVWNKKNHTRLIFQPKAQ